MPDANKNRERRPGAAPHATDATRTGSVTPGGGPPTPGEEAKPADRIGGYVVLGELGRGGMGVVYRAEDPALRREVALKVMLPRYAVDPKAKARFIREARAQATVEHDHVAAIFQVGESAGVPFIAMPLLRGMTLQAALRANPRPPATAIIRIGREVAEGLAAAHSRGLIHRDIKPANVWLEGRKVRVKILDFGLARAAGASGGDDSLTPASALGAHPDEELTSTGAIIGTPAYMSPEQARGEVTDHRSDLFSLGIILYEMATGRRPFAGRTAVHIMTAVLETTPPPVSESAPDLPPELGDIIARLLAKRPADRPTNAQAVADELHQLELAVTSQVRVVSLDAAGPDPFGDINLTESNPSVKTAPRSSPTPRWLWPVAGLAGLAGLAAAVWVVAQQPQKAAPPEEPPPPPRKEAAKPKGKDKDGPKEKEKEKPPEFLTRVPGYGLRFAPGDVLEVPGLTLPRDGEFTVEAFVTPAADLAPGQGGLLAGVEGLGMLLRPPGAHWRWYTFHGECDSPKPAVNGRTVHLAGVRTPTHRRLYLDGRLVSSSDNVTTKEPPRPGEKEVFRVGGGFAATVSEVRVSRVARYDRDFVPEPRPAPDKDTIALYHLDDGAGDEARDSSGNNLHGRVTGAGWQTDAVPEDPDRVAAEWLLGNGSAATIVADGKIVNVGSPNELPKTPFQVQIVNTNRNPKANDDTLRCLRGLRHLVTAQITNCAATDKTLTYLKDCASLEVLILYSTGVTDEGLKVLSGFPKLKSLNVTKLPVTEAAVLKLADALPGCTIVWDKGSITPRKKS